jgi:hypothetical protein
MDIKIKIKILWLTYSINSNPEDIVQHLTDHQNKMKLLLCLCEILRAKYLMDTIKSTSYGLESL